MYYTYSDGPFRGCSWIRAEQKVPLHKICYTYPTTMKLSIVIPYLSKI